LTHPFPMMFPRPFPFALAPWLIHLFAKFAVAWI
jgi:hypothetical protein